MHGERQYTKQYKTQNTQRREQNIQNKKTNIKRVNLEKRKIIN
jgi:hypothetical protein